MPQNDDEYVSLFDDLFVAGAVHQELSAQERAAAAREARTQHRRQDRRRRRRALRRRRVPGGRTRAIVVLVLLAGGYAWLEHDRRNEIHAGAVADLPESVRLVYAVPSDEQPDETLPVAARVEMGIVQQWLEEQTGGHTLRMDEADDGAATDVVELSYGTAELSRRPDAASLVDEDLGGYVEDHPDVIVLAFVPLTFEAQVRCGETGGRVAVVWVGSCGQTPSTDSAAFGDGTTITIAHELLHALGAVGECAPNYGRHGHVIDNPSDLMYDGDEPRARRNLILDAGRDDYFDTGSGDCWDVKDHPAWR